MPTYIHQLADWPKFTWDQHSLAKQLAAVRHRQGRLIGRMQALGFALREEAVLATLTEDVLKTSEIEGEILDKLEVRSSIARRLGMEAAALPPADRNVEGVVEMMLDATQNFGDPLTAEPQAEAGVAATGLAATYSLMKSQYTRRFTSTNPLRRSTSRIVSGGTHWSIVSQ